MKLNHISMLTLSVVIIGGSVLTVPRLLDSTNVVQAAATSQVVYIHYTPGYGIAVWNTYTANRHTTGKTLPSGTSWKVFNSVIGSDGNLWYNLGGNQWVSSEYAKPYRADIVTYSKNVVIDYSPNYGIAVWNSPDVNTHKLSSNKKLPGASLWKTLQRITYPDGTVWYNLGGNQWIDGNYARPVSKPAILKATAYDPKVLGNKTLGYDTIAANLSVYPRGTRLLIRFPDGHNGIYVVRDTGSFVHSNPKQIDIAMPNSQALQFGAKNVTVYVID